MPIDWSVFTSGIAAENALDKAFTISFCPKFNRPFTKLNIFSPDFGVVKK